MTQSSSWLGNVDSPFMMPVLIFVFALTAVDLAIYGVVFAVHAMLVQGFSISSALDVGGNQILFRVGTLQALFQITALWFAFKFLRTASFFVALSCAVITFVMCVMFFLSTDVLSVWVLFVPSFLDWDVGEGFALLTSVTAAWIATAAIRPTRTAILEKVE